MLKPSPLSCSFCSCSTWTSGDHRASSPSSSSCSSSSSSCSCSQRCRLLSSGGTCFRHRCRETKLWFSLCQCIFNSLCLLPAVHCCRASMTASVQSEQTAWFIFTVIHSSEIISKTFTSKWVQIYETSCSRTIVIIIHFTLLLYKFKFKILDWHSGNTATLMFSPPLNWPEIVLLVLQVVVLFPGRMLGVGSRPEWKEEVPL